MIRLLVKKQGNVPLQNLQSSYGDIMKIITVFSAATLPN